MPQTLSLILSLLAALANSGAAGVLVSLLFDHARVRFPRPHSPEQVAALPQVRRLLLLLLWTPVSAFAVTVLVSALAAVAVALLTGSDGWSALDLAIYNGFAAQVTWAIRWLALPDAGRTMAVGPDRRTL